MAQPEIDYLSYATVPFGETTQVLRARLFRPDRYDETSPTLLVWVHASSEPAPDPTDAGSAGSVDDLDAPLFTRIGRVMARWGYASAFVETRRGARPTDLLPATQDALPALQQEAAETNPLLDATLTGAEALAAMEDGVAFLNWLDHHKVTLELPDRIVLAGSSAGAMTVLNILNLAPTLGLTVPPVTSAVAVSGAYAYPSRAAGLETPVLALHNQSDQTIPVASIRAYAHAVQGACILVDAPQQAHGDLRLGPNEMTRQAIARVAHFATGRLNLADAPAVVVTQKQHRICLVATVGHDGPYLLEWVAHHQSIGVTDFLLFSDPSDDGTHEILNALHERGVVHHVPSPAAALGARQSRQVARVLAEFAAPIRAADYVIEASVSEFINVSVADGTLDGLLSVTGAPEVLTLTTRRYGFSGVKQFENRLVSTQFTQARQTGAVRHLRRRTASASTAVPPPLSPDLADMRCYPLRSAEAFLLRLALSQGSARLPYRLLTAWNVDTHAQPEPRGLEAVRNGLATFMRDSELLQLHRHSVRWHQHAMAQLWTDPGTQQAWAFMAPLLGPSQTTPTDQVDASLAAE